MPLRATLILGFAALCQADLYMHNPHGSNDRNRERDENRNNGNLLFDSQNNDKGGYPWSGEREATCTQDPTNLAAACPARSDTMSFMAGSQMDIEWTAQHACGPNPNIHCMLVVQYSCDYQEAARMSRHRSRLLQATGGSTFRASMDGLRDGYPTGNTNTVANNNDNNPGNDDETNGQYNEVLFNQNDGNQNAQGTERIGANTADNTQFVQHESLAAYQDCQNTQRNANLYTADQILNNNDATSTRQNPNGNRNGFECPEERDYFPYWGASAWMDVAVQTSNTSWCQYFQEQTPNVAARYYCANSDANNAPITQGGCEAQGGTWTERAAFADIAPGQVSGAGDGVDCTLHPYSEDNHLGKTAPVGGIQGDAFDFDLAEATLPRQASQMWAIPDLPDNLGDDELFCSIRLRYNMTSNDYPSVNGFNVDDGPLFDNDANCPGVELNLNAADVNDVGTGASAGCEALQVEGRPLYNRPYVEVFDGAPELSINSNTNQLGRTFQDRSFVFKIGPRDASIPADTKVYNLNTVGRRGNIVQSYPGVEYDFVPNDIEITDKDVVHWQWEGTDYNINRNPNNAEGWRYSDRTNIVEFQEDGNSQFPAWREDQKLFADDRPGQEFALANAETGPALGNQQCKTYTANDPDTNEEQNNVDNCGKLNSAKAHFSSIQGAPLEAPVTQHPGGSAPGGARRGRSMLDRVSRMLQGSVNDFHFGSTRNNNYSNRSQKSHLKVRNKPPVLLPVAGINPAILAVIIIMGVLFVGYLLGFCIWYKVKKNKLKQAEMGAVNY